MRNNYTTFPTNGLDGRVDGLVTLTGMKRVPPNMRAHRRGTDIMIPLAQLPVVRPDDLVTDVIQRVGVHSEGHALVFDGDQLVGIIGPRDIARRLQLGQQPRRAVSPAPSLPPTG